MLNLKNWRTDIKFTLPRFHVIRPNHYHLVAEDMSVFILKICFFICPFGLWKIKELIGKLIVIFNDCAIVINKLIDGGF